MVVISSILIIICSIFIVNKWVGHHTEIPLKDTMQMEANSYSIIISKTNNMIDESEIYKLIHSSTKLEREDWNRIELYINLSQNFFVQKLRYDYAMLSEDDIRIILLIRMGLEHKEIASSCNILLSSFRKRRSRLKKKMRVECDSISKFIRVLYN